ncbi:hypothetical protein HanHA89_Chr08g0303781 [Helianthus annuus]|nr:hypothetical protein HanHA89_Chr08g0303781 [Helianthus annuus]
MDKSPATNSSDASTSDESPSAVGSSSVGVSDPVEYSDFPRKSSVQLEFQVRLRFVTEFESKVVDHPSLKSEEYRQLFHLPSEEGFRIYIYRGGGGGGSGCGGCGGGGVAAAVVAVVAAEWWWWQG